MGSKKNSRGSLFLTLFNPGEKEVKKAFLVRLLSQSQRNHKTSPKAKSLLRAGWCESPELRGSFPWPFGIAIISAYAEVMIQWYHIQQESANYVLWGIPSCNRDRMSCKDTTGPFQRRLAKPSKHLTLILRTAYREAVSCLMVTWISERMRV